MLSMKMHIWTLIEQNCNVELKASIITIYGVLPAETYSLVTYAGLVIDRCEKTSQKANMTTSTKVSMTNDETFSCTLGHEIYVAFESTS